jgi:ribosomal protein L32
MLTQFKHLKRCTECDKPIRSHNSSGLCGYCNAKLKNKNKRLSIKK